MACFRSVHLVESLKPNIWVWGENKTIWNSLAPPRVNIFMWRVILDRVPTRVNLHKIMLDIDSVLCRVCGSTPETIDHMLFGCSVAEEVWKFIEKWWSISLPVVKYKDSMFNGMRARYQRSVRGNFLHQQLLSVVFPEQVRL